MPEQTDTPTEVVLQTCDSQTMSSREIAEVCEKQHAHVMRDIRDMLVQLYGEGGASKFGSSYVTAQNKSAPEYLLPKRETLILVSGYNLTVRAKIIDRWQALEAAAIATPAIPQSLPEALRLAADLADSLHAERERNAVLAPKATALDLISASEGSLTFTQAAKLLGVKQADMTRWMDANRWVYRQNGAWVAYRQHIENGRLEYKEANYTDQKTGMACRKPYCHITPKGLAKLSLVFSEERAAA